MFEESIKKWIHAQTHKLDKSWGQTYAQPFKKRLNLNSILTHKVSDTAKKEFTFPSQQEDQVALISRKNLNVQYQRRATIYQQKKKLHVSKDGQTLNQNVAPIF